MTIHFKEWLYGSGFAPCRQHRGDHKLLRKIEERGLILLFPRASGRKGAGCPGSAPSLPSPCASLCLQKEWKLGRNDEHSQGSGAETNCSRSAPWESHQKGNGSRGTRRLLHGASQHRPDSTGRLLGGDGPRGLGNVLQRPALESWSFIVQL